MEFVKKSTGFLSKGRGRTLWRDAAGSIVVLIGIAIVEQLVDQFPGIPEPAPLILVAVAISGFIRSLNTAVLSSLIGVAYALIFIPRRHELHGTTIPFCVEAIFIAVAAPLLAIMAGLLRQQANRTAETLQKHLTNTPLGVIELYDDFEVRLWAGAAEAVFGISEKEAVGKNLFDLPGVFFEKADAEVVRRYLQELRQGKRTKAVHPMRSEAKDGTPGHSRWFWSSVLDVRGASSRFLVLVEDVTERVRAEQELEKSKTEIIERLVLAAEYRDEDTGVHVSRMARYAAALAKGLGLSESECLHLHAAAPMHDIGKIAVPDNILLKPGKLTPEEFEVMKTHAQIGAEILSGSENDLVQMAAAIALTHHEAWDGSGYPNGLAGEDIPIVGRICAVCDVFDALASKRPYKEAWSFEDAMAEIEKLGGSKLDPAVVAAFLDIKSEIRAIWDDYEEDATEESLPQAA